jgi:hypothetical protein
MSKADFNRQELDTQNTDMDITRDGKLIGIKSTQGYPYVHTVTLLDGRTATGAKGQGKDAVLAMAEAK